MHGLGLECQVCCFILAIPWSPHTAGDLENRIYELQLQLREGRLGESVQHVEASGWGLHGSWMCGFMLPFFQEKRKIEEGMKEEMERMRLATGLNSNQFCT